jgi:hypothetical protein
MLNFTENGYLVPFEAIETDVQTAKDVFTFNAHRAVIWANFEAFVVQLQELLQDSFTVWLNGSFSTTKELPNDLDCVIFVDYGVYGTYEKQLYQFKSLDFRKSQKLDVYFVRVYPDMHEKKLFERFDRAEWLYLFSKTRKKELKGFLELNF